MGRPAASIQTEIDTLEAELSSLARASSYSINGRSKANQRYADITSRLDQLYTQLGRVNGTSPMVVRGRLDGMGTVA